MNTTTPDLAEQWKALNAEQRSLALSKMTAEQKGKLAASLGYKGSPAFASSPSFIDRLTEIQKPDPNDRWNPREAVKAVGNIGAGGLGMILHPIKTLEGVGGVFTAPFEMAAGRPFRSTVPGQMVESFKDNPYGFIEAGVGQAPVFDAALEVPGKLVRTVEKAPDVARTLAGTGSRSLRPLVKEVREANTAADTAHLEDARSGVEKQGDIRRDAIKKGREIIGRHDEEVARTREENAKSMKAQRGRTEAEQKLRGATHELQAQIETAREKALKMGNEKYSALNEKLNDFEADPEFANNAFIGAMDKIKGSASEPAVVKNFGKRIESGDILNYRDLQGFYSELNAELSKGNLPGDVYAAYDALHDSVGDEMQRIANDHGAGDQLLDARNYWRRMKQSFGKPYNPTDVANLTLDKVSPDAMREAEHANRLRLLGSFDESIPQTAEHISNLRKGLDALPKEKPLREILKPNPPVSRPVRVPPMREAQVPDRPIPKKIASEDIRSAKQASLEKTSNYLRTRALTVATFVTGYQTLAAVGRAMTGDASALGALPRDVAEGAMAFAGMHGLAHLLESPRVAELLTRPTEADIASIPPELRGDLSNIARQAQRQGIKVSPKLLGALGMAAPHPTLSKKSPIQ